MKVTKISLNGFRNLEPAVIEPCDGVNIIYGNNAQGKTNLIEAVWLFTGSRSFRGSKDSDYLPFGKNYAGIELCFFGEERDQTAKIAFSAGNKKVFVNEIQQKSVSGLKGKFNAVVFSPDHLSLVKDGPDERRNFLDIAIGQLMPQYSKYISTYNKLLLQRNSTLKDAQYHSSLLDMIDIWDEQLVKYGTAIASARLRYINLLSPLCEEIYSGISKGCEKMSMSYCAGWFDKPIEQEIPRDKIAESMALALKNARKNDLAQGSTSVGIHRDDINIMIDSVSLRAYGSQGQQRSCVLALKLAECGILYNTTGEHPVILLDDVMSELDSSRRDYLLNHLKGRQVFITCCDKGYFKDMQAGKTFYMKDGVINEEKE